MNTFNIIVVSYSSGLNVKVYKFIVNAVIHTSISLFTILNPVLNLIGKSNSIPASAIGVQKTKKLHVNSVMLIPCSIPYFNVMNMKYKKNIVITAKNFFNNTLLVSVYFKCL